MSMFYVLRDQLKAARISAGYSQTRLAKKAGIKQSALSMFESGDPHSLSAANLNKVAAALGVRIPEIGPVGGHETAEVRKYCSEYTCHANIPYLVRGLICFKPVFTMAREEDQIRCFHCGAELESGCPAECGRAVSNSAFCACGEPYVRAPLEIDDPETWVATRQDEQQKFLDLHDQQAARHPDGERPSLTFPLSTSGLNHEEEKTKNTN